MMGLLLEKSKGADEEDIKIISNIYMRDAINLKMQSPKIISSRSFTAPYGEANKQTKRSNAFAEWYNNRVHGALDLEYFETPNDAFIRKMRCENTLGMFFEWSEREVSL